MADDPSDAPKAGGGNRVFTREESAAAFGPHPQAHLGDEIRWRIASRRKGPWWKAPDGGKT